MVLPRAYAGTGDTTIARPYMEIAHNSATQDLTLTTALQNYVWSATTFDTTDGGLTFDDVDEITVVEAGDYRIDCWLCWTTTSPSRTTGLMDLDPLGGGSYAFVIGSAMYGDSEGSLVTSSFSLTLTLAATDLLRIRTRRLAGGTPSSTNGANGSIWRLTKLT